MTTGDHGYIRYSRGCCRCEICRQGKREYLRTQRANREALPEGDPRHGTYHAYKNLMCRCGACRQANNYDGFPGNPAAAAYKRRVDA